MNEMATLVQDLDGFGLLWSGLSYQEQASSAQTLWIYLSSLAFIFLCLAALYESWSIPLAVMLVIPLGILGAITASTLVGFDNDILLSGRDADDNGAVGQKCYPDRGIRPDGSSWRVIALQRPP
nr:putative rnd superfamily protein [Raoultella sp. NCTC 9187]